MHLKYPSCIYLKSVAFCLPILTYSCECLNFSRKQLLTQFKMKLADMYEQFYIQVRKVMRYHI